MRQPVEVARSAAVVQARQQCGQHRQQRHPLAIDLDPEIERKPPAAAAFLDLGGPLAAAVDDAMAEGVLDIDPPALAFEPRHGLVDKAGPVAAAVEKAEGNSTGIPASGGKSLDRAQAESLQPVLRRPLGGEVSAADDDPAVLAPAGVARRLHGSNQGIAIEVAEQCDIDPILQILCPGLPVVPAALAVG